MKGLGNLASWVLLGIGLAVPVFMCWNWFQRFRAQSAPPVSAPPSAASMSKLFTSDGEPGPVNPKKLAAAPAAPVITKAAAAVIVSSATLLAAAPRPSDTVTDASSGAAKAAVAPAAAAPPAEPSKAAAAAPASAPAAKSVGGGPRFEPKTPRDPMVSQKDIEDLKRREEEARQAKEREEAERLRRQREETQRTAPKTKPRRKEARPEDALSLQGIISGEGVRYALLNGEKYKAGDVVHGAKVVEIGASKVVFSYKGRTFTKYIR